MSDAFGWTRDELLAAGVGDWKIDELFAQWNSNDPLKRRIVKLETTLLTVNSLSDKSPTKIAHAPWRSSWKTGQALSSRDVLEVLSYGEVEHRNGVEFAGVAILKDRRCISWSSFGEEEVFFGHGVGSVTKKLADCSIDVMLRGVLKCPRCTQEKDCADPG